MTGARAFRRVWRRPWARMAALCLTAAATGAALSWAVPASLMFAYDVCDTGNVVIVLWVIAAAGSFLTYIQARRMPGFPRKSQIVAISDITSVVEVMS